MEWVEGQMQQLRGSGIVWFDWHMTCSSVAIAVSKFRRYRMVTDHKATNAWVELVLRPIRDLDVMSRFKGVAAFCCLDLPQGDWNMPLADEAHNSFTIFLPFGT